MFQSSRLQQNNKIVHNVYVCTVFRKYSNTNPFLKSTHSTCECRFKSTLQSVFVPRFGARKIKARSNSSGLAPLIPLIPLHRFSSPGSARGGERSPVTEINTRPSAIGSLDNLQILCRCTFRQACALLFLCPCERALSLVQTISFEGWKRGVSLTTCWYHLQDHARFGLKLRWGFDHIMTLP